MTVAGRYELEELVGAGGEARIFRARDRATGSDVALRLAAIVERESPAGQMPTSLHPAWVRLFYRGLDPEHGSFAVFELLHGQTLGAQVARQPLDLGQVKHFARQALHAVGALHEAGWVHGDLNEDNFLLDSGTTWKLLELPFHRPPPPADRSSLFGRLDTLAPEQIAGQAANAQSDLFALGCLFYYAASGRYPHGEGTAAETAVGRLRFAPKPLSDLAPGLPPQLSAGIMRLLARDPVERPETAGVARPLLGL